MFEWTMSKKIGRSKDDEEEKVVHCIAGRIHGVEKRVPNESELREPSDESIFVWWSRGQTAT